VLPKQLHPDLTFEWTNLVLACERCNGSDAKATNDPQPPSGPFVDPTVDEPSDHLNFVISNTVASVVGRTPRGVTTENLIRLNRWELRDYRSLQVRKLQVVAVVARTDTDARTLLADACKSAAEYAAFARRLWADVLGESPPASWE